MNKDWEEKKLEDLADTKKAIVSGPFGSNLKVSDYRDSGVPILRLQNIGKGKFIEKDIKYIEKEKAEELKSHSFVTGDIVLAKLGIPIGKTCIIPETFESGIILADLVRIRPDKRIVNYKYLEYFLNADLSVSQLTKEISGATRPRVNLSNVRNIVVPIPSLKIQNNIIEILDKAFESIEQVKVNIEKNIQNTKELFQSRLNEIFSQKSDGWEEKTLGEVCNLFQGLAINKKTKHLLVEKSSLPLLRIKDLKKNTEEQYVSEEGYPENSRVYKNEIIYTRTGSLGLVFRDREGILHNNSFKIIPRDELENNYLYWWLQHEEFTNKIIKLASKAAQPDITHKLFKEQIIIIPSKDKQKECYMEIVKLDKLVKELEKQYQQKLKNLEELKKSILQKAFKGELVA